jgi:hypothetical protein
MSGHTKRNLKNYGTLQDRKEKNSWSMSPPIKYMEIRGVLNVDRKIYNLKLFMKEDLKNTSPNKLVYPKSHLSK